MDSSIEGRSIARHLRDQGLDVFVGCLCGHGDGKHRSGTLGYWMLGDYVVLDLSAMVILICKMIGCAFVLVGYLLGGLVLFMYFVGVVVRDGAVVLYCLISMWCN